MVSPEEVQGSIEVGPYRLRVGGEAGALLEPGKEVAGAEAEELRQALAEREPEAEPEERAPAVASEIDEAAEATTKIEQAVALCKGVGEGRALDPDQLALEVGTLLDCLERLDRKKKHKKAIQLARALATLLMLLKRWAALLQTLRIALRAGEELGDEAAIAWAEHEIGTLRLAAGDVEGADRGLRRAREVRERIGDRRGMAATNRNMQVLCDRLREMLRSRELVRPRARSRLLLRLIPLAAVFALVFGGGAAAGLFTGDFDPASNTVEVPGETSGRGTTTDGGDTTGGEPDTTGGGPDTTGGGGGEEEVAEAESTEAERAEQAQTEEEAAAEQSQTDEELAEQNQTREEEEQIAEQIRTDEEAAATAEKSQTQQETLEQHKSEPN